MLKKRAADLLIRSRLQRMLRDPHPFNRLWGRAALLQFGKISDEDFRRDLDEFYSHLDVERCKRDIDFAGKVDRLSRSNGYKTDVLGLDGDSSSDGHRRWFDLWGRRFRLLRHLGVRSDVLVLRAGGQVPPHGHSQVVSGFFVLQGEVGIRHYDRVQEFPDHVLLRKVIDTSMGPGGYTTNSEYHHNIHWLFGLAPASYLFRFTVTDVPVRRFNSTAHSNTRDYVDPTIAPDASGLIPAPYITESEAKRVKFIPEPDGA